jgi:hypothetical protein
MAFNVIYVCVPNLQDSADSSRAVPRRTVLLFHAASDLIPPQLGLTASSLRILSQLLSTTIRGSVISQNGEKQRKGDDSVGQVGLSGYQFSSKEYSRRIMTKAGPQHERALV